jgi:transcriptional regulator with XRE-family HTH domain
MQEAIISYLAQGLTQSQVADIVGCSPSYISQLMAQDNVKERIQELKEEKAEEEEKVKVSKLEKKYLTLEERLIQRVENDMPFAEYKELLMLMQILHRRKGPLIPQQSVTNNTLNVTLQVPQAAVPELVLNDRKEVIGLGDSSLAPMGAQGVKALFLKLKRDQIERDASDVTEL